MKVWFIKNYMSPQMKRFLPHMAEHYGFDYEFVTYKWPSWLHKQVLPPQGTPVPSQLEYLFAFVPIPGMNAPSPCSLQHV